MSQSPSSQPSVCAICLTADRPEMTRRAVQCFKMQTASCERAGIKARMLIFDTSEACPDELLDKECNVLHVYRKFGGRTIGELRNMAITTAKDYWTPGDGPDIIVTFDSDDYSHPNRIAEQVTLLQSSGADVVGFNQMLFWREPQRSVHPYGTGGSPIDMGTNPGEAWLYSNRNPQYALGTSFCMWRSAWERRPFEATSIGEDERWLRGMKCVSVSSIGGDGVPRMVARIHPANTSNAYRPASMSRAKEWTRVPEHDELVRLMVQPV